MECLSLLSAPSVWMQGLLLNPELAELVQLANLLYEFSASVSQVLRLQVSLHPHPDWGGLNYGLYACMARTLPANLFPSPQRCLSVPWEARNEMK